MMKLYYTKQDRDARLAYWAPRIGARAAQSQIYSRICSMATFWAGTAYFVLIFVQVRIAREPAHIFAYIALAAFFVAFAATIVLYINGSTR